MKIAVSLPDPLFREAEAEARALGVSRSKLYARALAEFLEHRRPENVTAQLNEVYGSRGSAVDPLLDRMQLLALEPEKW